MLDEKRVPISDSEWEIMKVIWTKKLITSRELIELMARLHQWSDSTTKTLLRRLIEKSAVKRVATSRPYQFAPLVDEAASMKTAAIDLFDRMCAMRAGQTIQEVIASRELSKSDIQALQKLLAQKLKTAPTNVACNCLPADMKMEC